MQAFVYLMTNKPYGTLYVGVTNDLMRRVYEHREAIVEGFTKVHGLKHLVWYEVHDSMVAAITREKQIKEWRRAWKVNLIQRVNPEWDDLYDGLRP